MAKPRVVASIEARMGSSRLPGKVLMDINGRPSLSRLVERLRSCGTLDGIVVATSTDPRDDAIAAWAKTENVTVFRGSEDDVLQRVVDAQTFMTSDIVVEVTGDCPLICPDVIDMGVETFLANAADVVTNARVPSYPMGADVQVFRTKDLSWVAANIRDPAVREHVSLYFYEQPDKYRVLHLIAPPQWQAPKVRLQLDYPEDLRFIREVYARLEPTLGGVFGLDAIMALLKAQPDLTALNIDCEERAAR
ncbi:MAG: glycosyltransferase family protein [Rhodospirillaceae bacterium]|nr:glycosyltransferase family protein [Rhodospirillaceae bacterium]